MATALDIIKRAMRLQKVYSIGEEPSADEAQDMLQALNSMLESWATENLFIYAKTLDSIPLTANVASYTVGPTGGFVTERPIFVDNSSYIDYQGVSYPLQVWAESEYNQITVKTVGGIPCGVWTLMNYPDIQLTLWPVPSQAMTLNLWSNKIIRSFPDLTTDVALPPGYERSLAFALAEETAAEFGIQLEPSVVVKAAQARKNLKRINTTVPLLTMPYGIPNHNGYIFWQTG